MDMTTSIVPRSDQLNVDDLMAGPITVTIADVKQGSAEQPVDVVLVEYPGRAYRPSKSMRRVMVNAWGPDTTVYKGRGLTLYRNPDITFGREKVGGIEISHLSHIDGPQTIALTKARGKREQFTVQAIAARDWNRELKLAGTNIDAVLALGIAAKNSGAPEAVLIEIRGRHSELKSGALGVVGE
jgi:hypothetical protein